MHRLVFGLPSQCSNETDFRRLGHVNLREPSRVRHDRGLKRIAAALHLLECSLDTQLDVCAGDLQQRDDDVMRHLLSIDCLDRKFQRIGGRDRRDA